MDDSPIIRTLLGRLLSEYGDCDQARDGQEAILSFNHVATGQQPYDLICLDLNLPRMDGMAVLKNIRAQELEQKLAPRAKVLIISAEDDSSVVRSAIQLGADGYLVKPITKEALADRIANLFPERVARRNS